MKKKLSVDSILFLIFSILLIAMLVFGNWQLNRQRNKISEIEETVIENSQLTNAVVNFINANLLETQN